MISNQQKIKISSFLRKSKNIFSLKFYSSLKHNNYLIYFSDFNNNWGDALNLILFNKILNSDVTSFKQVFNPTNKKKIYGIGSIIDSHVDNSLICGSGFIQYPKTLIFKNSNIITLRGKLSANVFNDFGVNTPSIYGDPALLYPFFFPLSNSPNYKLGIIPHYVDLFHPLIVSLEEKYKDNIRIISPYLDIHEFSKQVSSCEMILSSSLHGLILSDSLGIPNRRFILSDKILGGDFKYHDYYSGVNSIAPDPIKLDQLSRPSLNQLLSFPVSNNIQFNPDIYIDHIRSYISDLYI